jgi:hypothetical protein
LTEAHEVQLIKFFEKKFPRSETLPCNSVRDYEMLEDSSALRNRIETLEDGVSDDELDIVWHEAVEKHFGDLGL